MNSEMAIDTEQHEQLQIAGALNVASDIAHRYQLSSLQPLIQSCRQLADRDEISVAVIGRFKAGKSSFLNHFLDRGDIDFRSGVAAHSSYDYGSVEFKTRRDAA